MAYISVQRFIANAKAAIMSSAAELKSDPTLNELFGNRLPRVYFLAGVLPSRDPDAIAAMGPGIDAEMAEMNVAARIEASGTAYRRQRSTAPPMS